MMLQDASYAGGSGIIKKVGKGHGSGCGSTHHFRLATLFTPPNKKKKKKKKKQEEGAGDG